ncbi:MAG: ParB/RepB/Spo0J family partition protein [Candidatus Portnoybacteria bacterium]|nr:ParB/RepB/Spo0J family partition protein [Candidatus Portnoybacteria bacterium]
MQNLGKGLNSLIPAKSASGRDESFPRISQPLRARKESVFDIEVGRISSNPFQPREDIDQRELVGLSESIKEHGILQPLIVTKSVKDLSRGQEAQYTLIAGHRRLAAAKMAGLKLVPAIIRDSTEQQKLELALVENIQRTDLNAIDRARAYKRLHDEFDLTHDEIGRKIGKSREVVTNTTRLLNLPLEVQKAIQGGRITEGHGRMLAGIKSEQTQKALFLEIIKNNLNVRQIEQRVREVSISAHRRKVFMDPEIKKIASDLTNYFGRKIQISRRAVGGRVIIEFSDKDDLERMIKRIIK